MSAELVWCGICGRDDWPHEHQGSWMLRLECCGRATGFQVCESWEAADEFRRDYCYDVLGHVRSAVVSKLDRPARRGFHDEALITPTPSTGENEA